jgi:hypothetical protein
MASPSIAHFGTTIIEAPPPREVPQREAPIAGDLAHTLRFLSILGLEPLIENMYEGIGRQYIWSRGTPRDADYLEVDSFTSYRAVPREPADCPRIGDTVFRITHPQPLDVYARWQAEGLVEPVGPEGEAAAFLAGTQPWILIRGPQGQLFEFGCSTPERAQNHAVYVWTDPARLEETAAAFAREFDLRVVGDEDFHGQARVRLLTRPRPGITLGLLTPLPGERVAPRWSEDIFLEAGYSHFRLGSFDKARTRRASREAFPDGGDVSFVYFADSYLELVQVHPDDPANAG